MRKLLNTLYVTSDNRYLSLKDQNILVSDENGPAGMIPLIGLEGIVSFSYRGASPALMGECAKRNISLCFLTPNGRFLARSVGAGNGNVLLRRTQYRMADDPKDSCIIARNMVAGKIYNQRQVLERCLRDHALRINSNRLQIVSQELKEVLPNLENVESLDSLRGIEGETAARYYQVFDEMILSQKADFTFNGRNRRPPRDNVNALLSFAYVMLANDCAAALESMGLDSYVGFLHRDRPGRTSLALDLQEELRAPVADRLVLTLINNRMVKDRDFDRQEDGAVLLSEQGRKTFLEAWQTKKREEITHPFLKEKIPWGLVPYAQSLLLSRLLRGDLEAYPPFFWK